MKNSDNEAIKTELPNGAILYVEATLLGGKEKIANKLPSFGEVTQVLDGITDTLLQSLKRAKPKKASVEFGLEIALESGQVTAMLVKGTGAAHLTLTLEWDEENTEQAQGTPL
jgi:hypothetical protein